MLCFSSNSEDTNANVTSSPELHTEQQLALLDGRRTGVTFALLPLTVALGLNLREDLVQPNDQTVLHVDRVVLQHCAMDKAEKECAAEEDNGRKSDHDDCE